jgi:hypothetical protein
MDTFTAVPTIRRFVLKTVDDEKLEDFYNSEDVDAEIPTRTEIYVAYEQGSGCPVPIQIEVDRIRVEYRSELPTDQDRDNMSLEEYLNKWRRVNYLLRRNLLLAVVRKLNPDSANVLAMEGADGARILFRCGWIDIDPDEQEETTTSAVEEETPPEGEVVETGELILLTSQPSTQG